MKVIHSFLLGLLLLSSSSLIVEAKDEEEPKQQKEEEGNSDVHKHHTHEHVQVNSDKEHHKQLYNQHHQHQHTTTNSRVLELSDRFLEIVSVPGGGGGGGGAGAIDTEPRFQPWLVKFYAPWCGHCKRLEPIFNHVAQALHNTPIRVGRVDCTRFPSVGNEFKIHGYPTIMFISGPNRRHVFQGDRDVAQIVRFAKRMSSPPVTLSPQPLSNFLVKLTGTPAPHTVEHNPARVKRSEEEEVTSKADLFFGLVRRPGARDELVSAFHTVAGKYQQHNEFFEFNEDVKDSTAFVYKKGRVVIFTEDDPRDGVVQRNLTSLMERWVGNERFPDFVHLTRGNLHQIYSEKGSGGKSLLLVGVVEEDRLERVVAANERRLLEIVKQVAENAVENTVKSTLDMEYLEKFPSVDPANPVTTNPVTVHYGWIGNPELANSIVAEHLSLPTLLIMEKSDDGDHKYYVFSEWETIDSEPEVENLLDLVKEGHFSPTVNANSFRFRLYRYVFDAKVSLSDMWVGNPVLTIVLFGLPLGFLSLILYSVCCGDIMDAREEDDESEVDEATGAQHEKRE